MKEELYQWQEECLSGWFANNGRGMVQAVTGSGKTLLALTAAERMEKKLNQNLRIKIVVPTSTLMQQWNKALQDFLANSCKGNSSAANLRKEIGLRGGGFKSAANHKYMIYVINSARYELARQILTELKQGKSVLLIADECHHYASGQNQLIFEFLPYIKDFQERFFSLGLSATLPSGESLRYLSSVLGRKIYHYGLADASARHTICPYDIYHLSLSFQTEEKEMYEDLSDRMTFFYCRLLRTYPLLGTLGLKERFELLHSLSRSPNRKTAEAASSYMNLSYRRKKLVCSASARVACACDLIKLLGTNEKIIIFSERIDQADELFQLLQKLYPEKVGRYHSKMGKQANKNVLERFRTGNIRILISCKAIDEGIDVPDASVGIILSGTSTQRQRIQRLGRILRKKDTKEKAVLYYLYVTESSEDSCFLPDTNNRRLFELSYDIAKHKFLNPAYDQKALLLLDEIRRKSTDTKKLQEAERCLQLGSIRSDWLLQQSDIDKQIEASKYISDKNYWICMKKLGSWDSLSPP